MNILHLSALQIWSMDGKAGMPSLAETIRGHVREGHRVRVLLPGYDVFSDEGRNAPAPAGGDQFELQIVRCRWFPVLSKLRIFFRRINGGEALPFPARWVLNLLMMAFLTSSLYGAAKKARRRGFVADLVYANNQYATLAGFLLGRLWKIPTVNRLYGTFLADLMKKPHVGLRYPTAAAGYLVPSSLLICTNDGTRGDEVARKLNVSNRRFRFWQNGIEPPLSISKASREEVAGRLGPKLRKESKWALSCSRLSYWKRIDRMIAALKVCRAEGADFQLIVAGDGADRQRLEEQVESLGLQDQVVWLGAVDHDSVWSLMSVVDAFLITNDVTNRCNPLYEASWAGLPVVSVTDPSTADLLVDGENALIADKDDAVALGKKLAMLYFDEKLAKKIGIARKKVAKSFRTWEERMKVEVLELEKIVFEHNRKKNR